MSEDVELVERLHGASNLAYRARLGGLDVVYKPVAGERPLWDFPDGRLARREVASFHLSELLGWSLVPPTWWCDGPHGPGMVQRWVETGGSHDEVVITTATEVPEGYLPSFHGYDVHDRAVVLSHRDSPALRRVALFDLLANNADRKGGHLLVDGHGRVAAIDHGLTFHHQPKLRTVLWGWGGAAFAEEERAAIVRVRDALAEHRDEHAVALTGLLDIADVEALYRRCQRLLAEGVFPLPSEDWPSVPWPAL